MPRKASVNVGQNVVDGHSMAVNSERDPHALVTLTKSASWSIKPVWGTPKSDINNTAAMLA